MEKTLPAIPAKRYFTIGEVSDLCGVKPYVLRYWEQEFTQLKPMKRRGNRRYYQHHEVLLIRRIRELLYDQGFTISGARNRLTDGAQHKHAAEAEAQALASAAALKPRARAAIDTPVVVAGGHPDDEASASLDPEGAFTLSAAQVRQELLSIRGLLSG